MLAHSSSLYLFRIIHSFVVVFFFSFFGKDSEVLRASVVALAQRSGLFFMISANDCMM